MRLLALHPLVMRQVARALRMLQPEASPILQSLAAPLQWVRQLQLDLAVVMAQPGLPGQLVLFLNNFLDLYKTPAHRVGVLFSGSCCCDAVTFIFYTNLV